MRPRSAHRCIVLLAALALVACGDAWTTAPRTSTRPLANFEETPPPPPLDDLISIPGGFGHGCENLPPTTVLEIPYDLGGRLSGRLLVNRPGTTATLDLTSVSPLFSVSPNARLREHRGTLVGQGTISIDVVQSGAVVRTLIVDLSTATGTLTGLSSTGQRVAQVKAELTRADGTPETQTCPGGATLWYRYAVVYFTY